MAALKIIVTILQIISALGLMATILLQSGRSAGISGAIAGGADTFFGKKKGIDALLSRVSIVAASLFLVLTLVLAILNK